MEDNAIIQRNIKYKEPFCWQSKYILREIRQKIDRRNQHGALCVYLALTELASNKVREILDIFLFDIANLSGLSEKTVSKHLKNLNDIKVIKITPQERTSDGRFGKMKIVLIRFRTLPKEVSKKDSRKIGVKTSDIKEEPLEESFRKNIRNRVYSKRNNKLVHISDIITELSIRNNKSRKI